MKRLFTLLHHTLNIGAVLTAGFFIGNQLHLQWLALMGVALAPLIQLIAPYDTKAPENPKVRLPRVSLLVFSGFALLLLFIPTAGLALWLGLSCLGSYLLNVYWATEP